jgi:RNA polymerase sigma factor (sigma-70 family)
LSGNVHHADDLALARHCADGDEAAWERFIRDYRPILYRAADTLDPSGGAREVADSLYADLYGVKDGVSDRRSLFHYFHGRSSLATWLRAVLSQRYIDRVRATRRLAPLPEADDWSTTGASFAPTTAVDPGDRDRSHLVEAALNHAIAKLRDRDRLRLCCYYVQQLTLAETGRVLAEHETTVSRHLARTRRTIREEVVRYLRDEAGCSPAQIAQSLESVATDPGAFDLNASLGMREHAAKKYAVQEEPE